MKMSELWALKGSEEKSDRKAPKNANKKKNQFQRIEENLVVEHT